MATFAHAPAQNFALKNDATTASRSHARLAILLFALVTRLLVMWFAIANFGAGWLYSRGLEMGYIAQSLVSGHGFASPFGGNTGPTALIAPGYPLLVAGVFRVLGTYSAASAVFLMLLHIAASVASVALMMHIAGRLFSERAARICGMFWACWLPLLWIPTIFWETSFSICMLLAMLALALRLRERPTRLAWFSLGVLCGFAVLINMALLITSAAVLCWLAFLTRQKSWSNIVLATCVALLIYSPWPVRNARTFHAFIPLRTTVGLELWMGNHEGSAGFLEEKLFPIYNRHELDTYLRDGELAYDKQKAAMARAWIAAHPAQFAKLTVFRFFRFWTGRGSRTGSWIYSLGATLTSLGGFAGLFLLFRNGRRDIALLFALPLLLFPLPYYITHAEFRYRLVVDPLLTILAAYAVTQVHRKNEAAV